MIFKGSGVALITPFDKDNNINYEKLEELIEFQISSSTDAIIICGTTGESATLSLKEKEEVIKFTVDKVNGRIPVIAGTGSNNTENAIYMSKYASKVNCDGLLIVTPYYNKCTQEGLYRHYKEIANNVDLPIILYNVPSRTGVNIEVSTLTRLSEIKNIVGIKEASSNISQIAKIANIGNDFSIYSGNDDQIVPILSLGGMGVISVLANIYPKQTHDICKYFFDNEIIKSRKLQLKFLDIINALFIEVNPIPVKEAMNILKFDVGSTRLPLCNMNDKNKLLLEDAINSIHTEKLLRI